MTRNDFILKTIIAMAANNAYRYSWHGRNEWANSIVDGAITLADIMEKRQLLISSESDGDG